MPSVGNRTPPDLVRDTRELVLLTISLYIKNHNNISLPHKISHEKLKPQLTVEYRTTDMNETKQNEKKVRFESTPKDENSKQVRFESALQIQMIPYNYKEDDIRASWYGTHDFHKFEHDNQRMAHRMMKKSLSDATNSTEYDLDGFECPIVAIWSLSKCHETSRTNIINAILRAQAKQKRLDITSSMYVPTMSKRLTKKDKEAAHLVGLRNERYARDYYIPNTTDEGLKLEKISHKASPRHRSIITNQLPKKHYGHRSVMKPVTH